MPENRRASDRELPEHTRRLLSLEPEEVIALRDALHVALSGSNRRAGDEMRCRSILKRLGEPQHG